MSSGGRLTFLARTRKVSKRSAPLLSVSPSLRCGATCDARPRGVPHNSLRARALRSNRCGKHDDEGVCPSAHARPWACASRHGQKGPDNLRAIAALGIGGIPPSVCACGRAFAGWHARPSAHAS
jgi:hypothetical protein